MPMVHSAYDKESTLALPLSTFVVVCISAPFPLVVLNVRWRKFATKFAQVRNHVAGLSRLTTYAESNNHLVLVDDHGPSRCLHCVSVSQALSFV